MQKLQCTICAGALLMDIGGEFATCESCGMKFDRGTIKRIVEGIHGYDDLLKNAETFLDLSDFAKAKEIFTEITNKYPDRSRGWWGLFESGTDGFAAFDRLDHTQVYFDRAIKFASDEEMVQMVPIYEEYRIKQETLDLERKRDQALADRQQKQEQELAEQQRMEINRKRQSVEQTIKDLNEERNFLYKQQSKLEGKLLTRTRSHPDLPWGREPKKAMPKGLIRTILYSVIVTLITGVFRYDGIAVELEYNIISYILSSAIFFSALFVLIFSLTIAVARVAIITGRKRRIKELKTHIEELKTHIEELDAHTGKLHKELNYTKNEATRFQNIPERK